jgi:hypothetical protein
MCRQVPLRIHDHLPELIIELQSPPADPIIPPPIIPAVPLAGQLAKRRPSASCIRSAVAEPIIASMRLFIAWCADRDPTIRSIT